MTTDMDYNSNSDWGIPDWRNLDAYLPPSASLGLWAWEWMRRSEGYRRYWMNNPKARDPRRAGWWWEDRGNRRSLAFDGTLCEGNALASKTAELDMLGRPPKNDEIEFRMDLTQPIDKQLRLLRAQFACEARRRNITPLGAPKFQRELFPVRLRVLDADAAGTPHADIARELIPFKSSKISDGRNAQKAIADHLKAARTMRDGDYEKIALMNG